MSHAIVTGASSGIGKAISEIFLKNDWSVTLIARSAEKLSEICEKWPKAKALPCDLSDGKAIASLEKDLQQIPVQALINNAGIYRPCTVEQDKDEVWLEQLNTNLLGAVRLTRLCWPQLKKQKGCVLNISSTLAIRPIANTAAYSASKAALNNWTQTLAIEGAPHGVRANSICPGLVDTPIHSYVDSDLPKDRKIYDQVQGIQPLGRTGKPQDIAFMTFQFCQPESQWITGTSLNIDGGILLNS